MLSEARGVGVRTNKALPEIDVRVGVLGKKEQIFGRGQALTFSSEWATRRRQCFCWAPRLLQNADKVFVRGVISVVAL